MKFESKFINFRARKCEFENSRQRYHKNLLSKGIYMKTKRSFFIVYHWQIIFKENPAFLKIFFTGKPGNPESSFSVSIQLASGFCLQLAHVGHWCHVLCDGLVPVPLSIFRSNSKFDENSESSSCEYTRPITTIFCTRHDSDTVVTCAKYRCDRPRIFYSRVFWIFSEFQIRSKYA